MGNSSKISTKFAKLNLALVVKFINPISQVNCFHESTVKGMFLNLICFLWKYIISIDNSQLIMTGRIFSIFSDLTKTVTFKSFKPGLSDWEGITSWNDFNHDIQKYRCARGLISCFSIHSLLSQIQVKTLQLIN